MERLDLDILEQMQVDPAHPAYGIDPLISAARIAGGLNAGRNTVLAHRNRWRTSGLLRGLAVFPNPALVRSEIFGLLVGTESAAARDRLGQVVDLSSEVFLATDLDERTWILVMDEGYGTAARWSEYLGRIDGLSLECPPIPIPLPPPRKPLTAFQWRLLSELRVAVRHTSTTLAEMLGSSQHTVARNYRALYAAGAFFAYPLLDYRRVPGVVGHLMLRIDRAMDEQKLRAEMSDAGARLLPNLPTVPGWFESAGSFRGDRDRFVGLLFHVDTASAASDVQRRLASFPEVRESRLSFPAGTRYFPRCFDRLVEGNRHPRRPEATVAKGLPAAFRPRARRARAPPRRAAPKAATRPEAA